MNAAGIFLAARLALVSIGQTARHFFSELASYCKIPLFLSNPLRQLLLCTKQEKKRGNACEDFLCLFYSLSSHSISKCSVGPTLRPLFLKGCFFTPPWEISFSQVLGEWGGGGRPGARFCLCRDRYLPDPVCADGGGGGRKSFKRVLNGAKKGEEARRMGNDGHAAASSSKSGGGVTLREVLFRNKEEDLFWGEK